MSVNIDIRGEGVRPIARKVGWVFIYLSPESVKTVLTQSCVQNLHRHHVSKPTNKSEVEARFRVSRCIRVHSSNRTYVWCWNSPLRCDRLLLCRCLYRGLPLPWQLGGGGLTSAWALGGRGGQRCLGRCVFELQRNKWFGTIINQFLQFRHSCVWRVWRVWHKIAWHNTHILSYMVLY